LIRSIKVLMIVIIRIIIVSAVIFAVLGFLFSIFQWLPHFPGDSFYTRENFTFYFPVITCAVISICAAAILWLTKKI